MTENEYRELEEVVRLLRVKCPWDRIQTNDSIKSATLEEAYEVVEAIDENNYDELKKELGDLLLHVIFHSVIAEEMGFFTLSEVISIERDKLIRRHPHVFGELEINDHHEVKANWEKIKLSEGRQSVVDGVPKNLPALLRAYRIQEKVAKVGFEWTTSDEAFDKLIEELNELRGSLKNNDNVKAREEFGDFLFALVNFARLNKIDAEESLRIANEKFIKRFQNLEMKLKVKNKTISELSKNELLKLWSESKVDT